MPLHAMAVVAFDGISPFHLSVPCLVFGDPHGDFPGAPRFDIKVCAVDPGPLTTAAGFTMHVDHGLEALALAQTIVVPSWRDPAEAPPPALIEALRLAAGRGAEIVGLCLGAFVLAEAGLLDGRRATTHWAAAAEFSRRYPAVRFDANVLYVEDGPLLTSAGTAAGIDCCLHLLRKHHGALYANHVARRLVVPPQRRGGQAQYIEQPLPETAHDSRLGDLLENIRAHLGETHRLDEVAARALMSRRTFTRRFRRLTGRAFGDWLLDERLGLTQRRLEESDDPLERIAQQAGFASPVTLRHHFRNAFGISPRAWREIYRPRPTGAARN